VLFMAHPIDRAMWDARASEQLGALEVADKADEADEADEVEAEGGRGRLLVVNSDDCFVANDGDCDDGAEKSDYSFCHCGTDESDCGKRSEKDCEGLTVGGGNYTYDDAEEMLSHAECTTAATQRDQVCTLATTWAGLSIAAGLVLMSFVVVSLTFLCRKADLLRYTVNMNMQTSQSPQKAASTRNLAQGFSFVHRDSI
jgi:hypothetical protein